MVTTKDAIFDRRTLSSVYFKHKGMFEKLVNNNLTLDELKTLVLSLVNALYGDSNIVFKTAEEKGNGSGVMASYSGGLDTFTFYDDVLEEIVKNGDAAKLMMLIFHEGTHKKQYMNRNGVRPLYKNIYDENILRYILKNTDAKEYGNIDPTSAMGISVRLAAHLSYLREVDETEARESSFENTREFLKVMSQRTLFSSDVKIRQYASENEERLKGLCNLQDGYDFSEKYGGFILNHAESWVANLDAELLANSLIKKRIYSVNAFDFSFSTINETDPKRKELKKNKIKTFLSEVYPPAVKQWDFCDALEAETDIETKIMSLMSDEQLLQLYESAKHAPSLYNINFFLFESFKTPEAKMKMAKDIIKEKRGDTLCIKTLRDAMDLEHMDMNELKEMLDTLLQNGEYKVASEFGEALIDKAKEVLRQRKSSRIAISNATELINHTIDSFMDFMDYELHEGILAKEQKRGTYSQMNDLFDINSKLSEVDKNPERKETRKALFNEYYSLEEDDDILYDPVVEVYKTGDLAEHTLSQKDVEDKFGIHIDLGDAGYIMNEFFEKIGSIKTEDLTDELMKTILKECIKMRKEQKEFEDLLNGRDK